jgi:hypothetical protein
MMPLLSSFFHDCTAFCTRFMHCIRIAFCVIIKKKRKERNIMDMNKLYKKAYIVLFNSITDALAAPEMAEHILKNAQQLAEEIILTGAD